jgi:hypothetical protein
LRPEPQPVLEELLATEQLIIRVSNQRPHSIGEIVHVFKDRGPGHQPGRQRRMAIPASRLTIGSGGLRSRRAVLCRAALRGGVAEVVLRVRPSEPKTL